MFRRVFCCLVLAGLAYACDAAGDGGAAAAGRLRLSRTDHHRATLVDQAALARYCERDSTLSVAAVGERWSSAVAVRTAWPLAAAARLEVAPLLAAGPSAALAVRPLGDSIQYALIAVSGSLSLEPGAFLNGRLEARLTGASDTAIVTGRFVNLPVRTGVCP